MPKVKTPSKAPRAKRNKRASRQNSHQLPLSQQGILKSTVAQFAEKAYLNYSMYVILDRALPHLSDGLKPVQRRIIYAMSELSLKFPNKPKKSARTVGDVIGKFHPHGDGACYEAMVLMAQNFTFRYPLIDGQGNWGSCDDPKSFAAMRYTESRLTAYSNALLSELMQGTVEWQANFDGTLYEPKHFPARLPNILLNGTTGIAVGMSTDIPPHNLREVIAACEALLKNSRLSDDEVIKMVHAPDYPTGGDIITPLSEIHKIYKSGNGTIKLRATYQKDGSDIIINSIPYRGSMSKVMAEILDQIKKNKHLGIKGIRDESDEDTPVRLVIINKRDTDSDALMSHLFASTSLEQTCRINLNLIDLDGKPRVLGVAAILKQWVAYRLETVKKRLEWRQHKIDERLEILAGLLIAHLNIDEVIRIIRTNDEPEKVLMKKFELSEVQVNAILAIRLKQLGRLQEIEIRKETQGLEEELKKIKLILSSPQRLRTRVSKELASDAKEYGDARRTQVVKTPVASATKVIALEKAYPLSIILSQKSWVFSLKGHDADLSQVNYRTGDALYRLLEGQSDQITAFLASDGRSYCITANQLPNGASHSEPLSSKFKVSGEASFVGVCMGDPQSQWIMASSAGYGFIVNFEDLTTRNRAGRQVLRVPQGAHSLPPTRIDNSQGTLLVAITSKGYALAVEMQEIPELTRGKGNKIIGMPKSKTEDVEYLKHIAAVMPGETLVLRSGKRHKELSYNDLQNYLGTRGRRGRVLPIKWRNIHSVKIK